MNLFFFIFSFPIYRNNGMAIYRNNGMAFLKTRMHIYINIHVYTYMDLHTDNIYKLKQYKTGFCSYYGRLALSLPQWPAPPPFYTLLQFLFLECGWIYWLVSEEYNTEAALVYHLG